MIVMMWLFHENIAISKSYKNMHFTIIIKLQTDNTHRFKEFSELQSLLV